MRRETVITCKQTVGTSFKKYSKKKQNNEEYIMILCYRINWSSQVGIRFIYQNNMKQKLEESGKITCRISYTQKKSNKQTLIRRLRQAKQKLQVCRGELEQDTILLLRCTLIGNHTNYV